MAVDPLADLPVAQLETHLTIAELAVQHGYCSYAEVGRVLYDLQALLDQDPEWSAEGIWVDAGPLDATEWQGVMAHLRNLRTPPLRSQEPQSGGDLVTIDRSDEPEDITADQRTAAQQYAHPVPMAERYTLGSEFGRGGGGKVVRAFDQQLERIVAMKLPTHNNSGTGQSPLHVEASATAHLEHPNIVPIYDAGRLSTGQPFYTMRRVSGRSLREILQLRKQGDPHTHERWPIEELYRALTEVMHAMEYAHFRQLIHRDLKPENIMLGEFGEVYVMDWGLAQRSDDPRTFTESADPKHLDTVGTPAYMSPEQASGQRQLQPASDIYSLGVILYELVTGVVPSRRDSIIETLLAVTSDPIAPPSKIANNLADEDLDAIVMRALERDPEARYPNMRAFRQALQVYLTGKRPTTAARLLHDALQHVDAYDAGMQRSRKLRARAQRLAAAIQPSDSIADKRDFMRADESVEKVENENAFILEQAMDALHQALRLDPTLDEARNVLAALGWRKHQDALENLELEDSAFFRSFLKQYDISGHYAKLLDAPSQLRIFADSEGIDAFIQGIETRDRRMHFGALRYLGKVPLQVAELPRGSWRITLKQPGAPAVRVPISAYSEQAINLFVPTAQAERLPKGFQIVTQGSSLVGGDRHALDPLARQLVSVPSFAVMSRHVLLLEYLEWLRSRARYDLEGTQLRLPVLANGMKLIRGDSADTLGICLDALHTLNPSATVHDPIPVVGVRAHDAEDYIRWKGSVDGRRYRLPTELEYERMARGADRRIFPWGNHFDAALCNMVLSTPGGPRLHAVGHALADVGPFGQRDLAGNVRELCLLPRRDGYVLRGGSWRSDRRACRATSRVANDADQRADDVGFRLSYSL